MLQNEFKVGDMVLVIDSYGGGLPFIGLILPLVRIEKNARKDYPNCIYAVTTANNGSILCEAVPLTPLLKALV